MRHIRLYLRAAILTMLLAVPAASHAQDTWVKEKTYTSSDSGSSFTDVTYYDGLGYPVQLVAGKAGGTSAAPNLVTPIVYDNMRRDDAVSYLPYASNEGMNAKVSNVVSKQAQFYAGAYPGETRAYAEKVYETSPVGRPLSATREGAAWLGHPATMDHTVNDSQDDVMRFSYDHGRQAVQRDSIYAPCSLVKTTATNEDGQRSVVFTDVWGKTVCSRQFPDDGTVLETSYVYDLKDSLVCVIQPKGMDSLRACTGINAIALDGSFARSNCFTYLRDALGRVRRSVVPGGAVTDYAYDQRGRLRLMSTERMKDGPSRMYVMTIYDDYDRPATRAYIRCAQESVEQIDSSLYVDTIPTYSMVRVLYNASYYPFTDGEQSVQGLPFDDEVDNDISSYISSTGHRGLLKSETIYDVNGISNTYSSANITRNRAYYYDGKGRVIQMRESDSDGPSATYTTFYDLVGNVTTAIEEHVTPGNVSHTLRTEYTRDARGRVLSCTRIFDGSRLPVITYSYDALGRLAGKDGGSCLSESYDYDLHGWISGIEAGRGADTLFSESIRYGSPLKPDAVPLYSGGISEISSLQHGGPVNTYSYSYDGSSRLTDARHFIGSASVASDTDTERSVSYDANGNVMSLARYGASDAGGSVLGFSYTGNHMTGAADSVSQESFTFACDADGNRTSDGRTGLEFSYNILNLPCEVHDGQQNMRMRYTYLSDGTKVSAFDAAGHGLLYRGNFVYDKTGSTVNLESMAWDEGRIRNTVFLESYDEELIAAGDTLAVVDTLPGFPGRPGRPGFHGILDITAPLDTAELENEPVFEHASFQDQWFVKDHLGNVRSVIDLSATEDATADDVILEQDDYLPFGTKVSGGQQPRLTSNRYRYAGKEEQRIGSFSTQLLDFGARSYDPWSCQWTAADPLAEKYPGLSPYCYCGNDPVIYIDVNGKEWVKNDGTQITDLTKVKVYIFFTDDFRDQAMQKYDAAVKKYGDGAVALSNTGKVDEFKIDWESMDGSISDVYILAHGKNQSINFANDDSTREQITSTGTGKTNLSGVPATNLDSIHTPKGNISSATLHLVNIKK